MSTQARRVASGFGLGRAPAAPGTVASAAAVLAGAVILRTGRHRALAMAAIAAVACGLEATRRVAEADADPGWIVIDEIAGQWIAMLGLGARPGLTGLAASFALFRGLDIAKPGPVGWADRRGGAVGVMLDDVIAGALAALLLRAGTRILGARA